MLKKCLQFQASRYLRNTNEGSIYFHSKIPDNISLFTDNFFCFSGLKQIDINTETMTVFLQLLQNNCMQLNTLELNESTIDNDCCNIIGELSSLSVLNLNHCTKLESAGVLHLLKKLDKLTRIDALRGKSSNVQNALDILASENKVI